MSLLRDLHRSGDPLADRRAGYAADLAADGDAAAAADLMRQALERAPDWPAGWMALGGYLGEAGDPTAAAAAYGAALRLDPEDGQGAALRLATLGRGPVPQAAPAAFVRGLFDQYADRFEASLVGGLGYGAPDHLMTSLSAVTGTGRRYAHALDLGCGTGLMGERLRPVADLLTGIDLSPAMVEKARRKALYDHLAVGDIVDADAPGPAPDLVTAADVLIYVGDLQAVLARAADLLSPGGLLALTVEAHDGDEPYVLGSSLRYAHSRRGVVAPAASVGLTLCRETRFVIRQDRGAPVDGLAFVFERAGR